jgi:cystathionine beta-lyase/cystathionine gamma-synthase
VIDDGLSPEAIRHALEAAAQKGKVRMCYIETPANPTNALFDLEGLRQEIDAFETRHGYRPLSVCDNTLLGPLYQKPVKQGIDLCVYSLTKYVGGHSDLVAGGVTGSRSLVTKVRSIRSALGSQLDPHSSWMITRSMETLVLRMEQAARSGTAVAQWLASNPHRPVKVLHPELNDDPAYQAVYRSQCTGPGSTFAFVLDGGREQAFRLINSLELFKSAVSLGGTESLICHPASTTHSGVPIEARAAAGVSEGLIRVSVGLEHPDDLIADLSNALEHC